MLSVASFALRQLVLARKTNAEEPQQKAISRLDVHISFDQRLKKKKKNPITISHCSI